jgi:hypothetical protein
MGATKCPCCLNGIEGFNLIHKNAEDGACGEGPGEY